MTCPVLLGSTQGLNIKHLGLDVTNGWIYAYHLDTGIKRWTYPGMVLSATILLDATVAGLTCDNVGNLYYILNDGVAGNTTVYKRTPGGTTTVITSAFGTEAGFGLTWNPVDGLLYMSIQRFSGSNVSAITSIDPATAAIAYADTPTPSPPYRSAAGAPQATPDGAIWFYDPTEGVSRIAPGGARASATDNGLSGNETVVPTPDSTVILEHSSGDREYTTPSSSTLWACSLNGDLRGVAHTDDWRVAIYTTSNNVYEITFSPEGSWQTGRVTWPG